MTSTEIAVGKVLIQLTANYDSQEAGESAAQISIICAKPKHSRETYYLSEVNHTSFRGQNLEVLSMKFVDASKEPHTDLRARDLAVNEAPGAWNFHVIGGDRQ